jgi:hypothetical protein
MDAARPCVIMAAYWGHGRHREINMHRSTENRLRESFINPSKASTVSLVLFAPNVSI